MRAQDKSRRDAAKHAEQARRAGRDRDADNQARSDRLADARRAHRKAVDEVKEATRSGRGKAEADAAWRAAKALLLELETGERPTWAPPPPEPDSAPAGDEPRRGSNDDPDAIPVGDEPRRAPDDDPGALDTAGESATEVDG